nr:hypothetical protein [Tanacetum cinerariifolium]
MHGDETPDAYLNHAQEYANALAAIGKPIKDKDLVMLVFLGLREEYNGLKTTITARQSLTAFSELHALLSDHDYMLGKTHTPIAPYRPQAFYGARPLNNNRSTNRGNRNNSRGNNNRGRDNGHQFDWSSTQNTVYGTCNRCGIGHIPSQCHNRDLFTIRTRPSANFANTRACPYNASANWHSNTRHWSKYHSREIEGRVSKRLKRLKKVQLARSGHSSPPDSGSKSVFIKYKQMGNEEAMSIYGSYKLRKIARE